jgi:tetratricopeptide (TPR) repeat protein
VAVVGNSIRVYWVDEWPQTPASSSHGDASGSLADGGATHGVLAQLLLGMSWFDLAAHHYRQFLSVYPENVGAVANLGVALMQSGDADEGIRTFRRAVRLQPDYGIARQNLARALLEHGEAGEAGIHALEAVNLDPANPAARLLLGRALGAQGRSSDAMTHIGAVLELDPTHAEARELWCHAAAKALHGPTSTDLPFKKYCLDGISPTDAVP